MFWRVRNTPPKISVPWLWDCTSFLGIRLSRRRVLQKQLTNIIMRVLCRNSELNYYQVITLLFYINPSRLDLEQLENVFNEGKIFIKPFAAPQRSMKIKI